MSDDSLPVGWVYGGGHVRKLELLLSTLCRHCLVTGSTGWGKSAFLLSILLQLYKRSGVGITLVDLKGETAEVFRDHFLVSLASANKNIRPDRIVTIAPFSRYGVPLNPLHPIPGLSSEVQANLVCSLVGSLVDGGLGPRMNSILAWLVQAVMAVNGNLADVLALINDDRFRLSVAGQVSDPAIRTYLLHTFETENRSSRDALRARLEWILLLPAMRGALCADSCLRGQDLIEAPITVVDLGSGVPQGFAPLARFVGGFIFQLLTAAVFSRPVTPETRPVLLCVDEWQELVKVAPDDFERLLAQARFRKVGVWLVNQALAQVDQVSSALTRCLTTNIALHVAFRPDQGDLKHLMPLLPVTGRRIDPDRPDQLLSRDKERQRLLESYARLPIRHAVLADLVGGQAQVIRTLTVPYEQARKRAEQLPQERIEQFRQGRFGVPVEELLKNAREGRGNEVDAGNSEASSAVSAPQSVRRGRTRPKLELPS